MLHHAFEGSCPFLAAVRSVLVAGAVPRGTDLTASSWCLVRADHFRWQQRPPQSSRNGCRVCARLCPKAWGSVKNHSLIVSNLEKVWRVYESIVIQVPYKDGNAIPQLKMEIFQTNDIKYSYSSTCVKLKYIINF